MLTFGNSFSERTNSLEELGSIRKAKFQERTFNNENLQKANKAVLEELEKEPNKQSDKKSVNSAQIDNDTNSKEDEDKTRKKKIDKYQQEKDDQTKEIDTYENKEKQIQNEGISNQQGRGGREENVNNEIERQLRLQIKQESSKSNFNCISEGEDHPSLKIVSPKGLKKPIELADFEKALRESKKNERKRKKKQNMEWMSPSSTQKSSNVMPISQKSEIQSEKGLSIMSAEMGQMMEMIVSLIIKSFIGNDKNQENSQNQQRTVILECVGVACTSIILAFLLILKNKNSNNKQLTIRIRVILKLIALICFTECRIVPLISFEKQESQMNYLEVLLIGSIYFSSVIQLLLTKQEFNTDKKLLRIQIAINISLAIYFILRVGKFNILQMSQFTATTGLIIISVLLLSDDCSCQLYGKSGTQNSPFALTQKNNNDNTPVFSPRFGGGQGQIIHPSHDSAGGKYFFNSKAAVSSHLHNSSFDDHSNPQKEPIPQTHEESNKVSVQQTQEKNILSPKLYVESMQFASPRDLLDSQREMFFQNGQKDGADEEIGALEKAAAEAAKHESDRKWGNQNKNIQDDENEEEEEENKKDIDDRTQELQEQQDDCTNIDEQEKEAEEMDISDNQLQNIALFQGERSDLSADASHLSIRRKKRSKGRNDEDEKKKNQKEQNKNSAKHQSPSEDISQFEIKWRLQLQDLILGSLNEGIIVISYDSSDAVYANRQACHLLSTSVDQVLVSLFSLRNIFSYKDDILNFSEIVQQFEKPSELSELLNVKGMYSNLHSKREMMICAMEITQQSFDNSREGVTNNNQDDSGLDSSFINSCQINGTNINDNTSKQLNAQYKNQQSTQLNLSSLQYSSNNTSPINNSSYQPPFQQNFPINQDNQGKTMQQNQLLQNNNSSIKAFFDKNIFIMIEMEIIQGSNRERYVLVSLKKMGWTNPLCTIHASTLKIQYFIRKMISELSVDMNDMKDYFISTRCQPAVSKIDIVGCLGKLECMAEFLQDFATSSLIFSGTFVPIRSQINLPTLIQGVLNKIGSRTASDAYSFLLDYEKSCPEMIFSDSKRLERVFYNLLLYFVDTNEQAVVQVKITSLTSSSIPDSKRIKVLIKCAIKHDPVRDFKYKNEPIPLSLTQKKANITNVFMLENMHYGVLLSSSIIQKLEPSGQGIFFQTGSNVSFSFKLSI